MTGTLQSRIFEAAFTFAILSAAVLASNSFVSNSALARPALQPEQAVPFPATLPIPLQHRGPAQPAVHHDPQPFTPISSPVVSAPAVPAPVLSPPPPVNRLEPLRINPADRQQIVASHANELRREHCLRKLEARQRVLRQRNAGH